MSRKLPLNQKIGSYAVASRGSACAASSSACAKKEVSRVFRTVREDSTKSDVQIHRLKSAG